MVEGIASHSTCARAVCVHDVNSVLFGRVGRTHDRGGHLPTELDDWIRAEAKRPDRSRATPASPFTVARRGQHLVVQAAGPDLSTLLLAEEPAPTTPLTAREWDVVRCIAAGNSNAEIARLLWIAPGTVRKHLEHIYGKLGVRTRTAVVVRLRRRLADSPRAISP